MEYEDHELEYYWIVLCKNHHYHLKQSQASGHPILLGETDSVSPPPYLERDFKTRCDDCGKEYSYSPRALLRYETEPPASFVAHPLFVDYDSVPIPLQIAFNPKASPASSLTQIVRNLFQRSHR